MDSLSNYENTEQLINDMMSFLDEPTECFPSKEIKETNNSLCSGIKNIIEMFPPSATSAPATVQDQNRTKTKYMDKACRYKDPYMQEVNRLMFCSTMGHPPNNSPEYFKTAESYALSGKNFLDFPKDNAARSSSTLTAPLLTGVTTLPSCNNTQMPLIMNPSNYWNSNYPFYPAAAANYAQPSYLYSNPFLMTQYLNMFVRETSIIQQQQFLTSGIHERLVYAQMLQQQTNPVWQGGSQATFLGGLKQKTKMQEMKKLELSQGNSEGFDCKKTEFDG